MSDLQTNLFINGEYSPSSAVILWLSIALLTILLSQTEFKSLAKQTSIVL
jgi:hypothetical protein